MCVEVLNRIRQLRCTSKDQIDERYVEKAKEILSSFDCFLENQIQQKKFAHHPHAHGHPHGHPHAHPHHPQGASGHGYQKRYSVLHYQQSQPTIQSLHCSHTIQEIVNKSAHHLSFDPSTFKMIMGCLNKMSKSNVDKLALKIKDYLTSENSQEFVNVIIDRCGKESNFITLYLRCLQTIKANVSTHDSFGNTLFHHFQDRFNDWDVSCKSYIATVPPTDSVTEYDSMVHESILKRKVENTVRMFLIFGSHGLFEADLTTLVDRLHHFSKEVTNASDLQTELFLVQCKQIFLMKSKLPHSSLYEGILSILQGLTNECTPRLRFLILDIIESYHS